MAEEALLRRFEKNIESFLATFFLPLAILFEVGRNFRFILLFYPLVSGSQPGFEL